MYIILHNRPVIGPLNIHGVLSLAGVVGPVVLFIGDLTAGLTSPGYSLIANSISSLALTRLGWLQTIGFLAIGLLVEIYTAGMLFSIRARRWFRLSIGLLVFFGFGMLMIGAFRTDAAGAATTIEGAIHGIASKAAFIIFPIAALLIAPSIKHDERWRHLYRYTIATVMLGFLLIIVVLLTDATAWFGLTERLLVANMIIWVEVTAVQSLLISLRQERRPGGSILGRAVAWFRKKFELR